MPLAESLALWGVQLPADVVQIAAQAGLPVNIAAALLEQESGGGRNLWGSDAVDTGGIYVKGSPVTREAYLKYKEHRATLGNQGVGPCQLTSSGFQDQADALGGCWVPQANMLVGFRTMANLIRSYGTADGIRRYNGSGPWAERYREQMLVKLDKWALRLGSASTITGPVQASTPAVNTFPKEDEPAMQVPITVYPDGTFHGGSIAEEGSSSDYVSQAAFVFGVMWGSADVYIQFLGVDGLGMGPESGWRGNVGQNGTVALNAPNGCKLVSVEGRVYGQGVIPTAVLFMKPK